VKILFKTKKPGMTLGKKFWSQKYAPPLSANCSKEFFLLRLYKFSKPKFIEWIKKADEGYAGLLYIGRFVKINRL
jgi:hypothetical protein